MDLTCFSEKQIIDGCQCKPCVEQRQRISKHERGSLLNPKLSKKCVHCTIDILADILIVHSKERYF